MAPRSPSPLVKAAFGRSPLDSEQVVTQLRAFPTTLLVVCLCFVLKLPFRYGSICATICGMGKHPRRVSLQSVARETVTVDVPELSERERARGAAHQATLARTRWHLLEERAIKHGRAAGVSWDELGRWLLCPGESLRRRYAEQIGD